MNARKSVAQVLTEAWELISVESRWTKGSLYRDAEGRPASVAPAESAVCWCAVGAITHVCGAVDYKPAGCDLFGMARQALSLEVTRSTLGVLSTVQAFNDRPDTTHDDICKLYAGAIAAESAR